MQRVKIVSGEKTSTISKLTRFLTLVLALFTGLIILVAHDNPSLTGYAVFNGVYGAASPYLIVFLVLIIVVLYVQLHKK